ncbi:MAG: hypothetical protein L0Y72_18550 [Gemmataceae bacterium]|nr:hypothetical protein [Gemmataceae bacterium]MCI0741051.1 hypothetical protein [Gemmataceae bacterium]
MKKRLALCVLALLLILAGVGVHLSTQTGGNTSDYPSRLEILTADALNFLGINSEWANGVKTRQVMANWNVTFDARLRTLDVRMVVNLKELPD